MVANTLDALIADLQNYIVAPMNAFGMGGLVFNVQGEDTAILSADITDHYSEDNKALQDHMAIRPVRITLKGYVGEVIYNLPTDSQSNTPLQQVTQNLTTISAYLPQFSAAAQQIQQTVQNPLESDFTLAQGANIYSLVKNAIGAFGPLSDQQAAYQYFKACQSQAILMGVQTPWEFLPNMAVETIVAVQSEDTIFITEFTVTFKQLRIAQTQTATTPLSGTGGQLAPGGIVSQGAAALQSELPTNNGIVPGIALPYSGLPSAQASIVSVSSLANNPLASIFQYQNVVH